MVACWSGPEEHVLEAFWISTGLVALGEMGATIFVKMTGPEALINEHLLDFKRFCYYLKIGNSNG